MTLNSANKLYWLIPRAVASYRSPGGGGWPRIVNVEWMGEHGWGLQLSMAYADMIPSAMPPVTANFDLAAEPVMLECAEFNVPVQICINEIFYWTPAMAVGDCDPNLSSRAIAKAMPGQYWIDTYGDMFTALEDRWGPSGYDGNVLEGYWSEACFDNGAAALREMTDLEIWQGIGHRMWRDAGNYGTESVIGSGTEPREDAMTRRMGVIDGVDIELWCVEDVGEGDYPAYCIPDCAEWIRTNFRDMPIGLNSMRRCGPLSSPYPLVMVMWPILQPGDASPPPFTTQEKRFLNSANIVKERIGAFDRLSVQSEGGNETISLYDNNNWAPSYYKTDPTWWEFQLDDISYWESMSFTSPASKGAFELQQYGYLPYYVGAGYCAYTGGQTDTFNNTGNELILLKNYVDNCAVHEITVTSTDALTHEDYTLTCLPNRGTFIGPYPVDEYGALPTIEYDNTNLYVSILKAEPTA